jgi:hypothetical protein
MALHDHSDRIPDEQHIRFGFIKQARHGRVVSRDGRNLWPALLSSSDFDTGQLFGHVFG